MQFISLEFIVFFALVTVVYYIIPYKGKSFFLLGASILFYMFLTPWHVVILLGSTAADFFLARAMGKKAPRFNRKGLLFLGLLNNVGLLFVFKYLSFSRDILSMVADRFGYRLEIPPFHLLLPLGISYYTFKKIGYLADIYRETYLPERSFGLFALYVSIFPGIAAGPIDRADQLLPQLRADRKKPFDIDNITEGLKQIIWGFFKKIVIADNLALVVNTIYNHPRNYTGLHLILATVFFSCQIYCDFSGYSDIAIGAGRVLGLKFAENFNRPYSAASIADFWKRWHITLSSWLRDYLFLPVAYGFSRKIERPAWVGIKAESWAYVSGIFITMTLCGLWHGANWTFILWGAIHGIYLVASFSTKKLRKRMRKWLKIKKGALFHKMMATGFTFCLVTVAWIFFKADSVSDAFYILTHLFSGIPGSLGRFMVLSRAENDNLIGVFLLNKELGTTYANIIMTIAAVLFLRVAERLRSKGPVVLAGIQWVVYIVLIYWILVFGRFGVKDFIYAQF